MKVGFNMLVVQDVERALRFYRDVLGLDLQELDTDSDTPEWARLALGDAIIVLRRNSHNTSDDTLTTTAIHLVREGGVCDVTSTLRCMTYQVCVTAWRRVGAASSTRPGVPVTGQSSRTWLTRMGTFSSSTVHWSRAKPHRYDQHMAISDRQLLDSLSRTPFVDSAELARILGEAHATVHRALTDLLAEDIVGRVSHGTAHLPSSHRYHLTAQGIKQAAGILGFDTPSDFVRAYLVSREWLALLIRRMDAVAAVCRLASSLSPGIDGLRSHVEFHRRGRFDDTITLHDGRSFGVVRQGLALRRRSLYDRLRAIAQYDYTRRPDTVLILTPSVWEERLTTRFCEERNLRDCYVAVESREALERRNLRLWCSTSWVIGSRFFSLEAVRSRASPGGAPRTASPERKRASLPRPERMVRSAPAFGISPSEKRTLELITDHPMIPREHLALWLGVSEGRVSQTMHSLVNTWSLVERRG